MKIVRRREALILGGAAALAASGKAFAQEPPKPAQIVVNHSGGSMGSAMRKAFFNGFEKKYGIRVVETSPADFGKLAPWSSPATSNGTSPKSVARTRSAPRR